jgi:hypothetical protein
MFGVLSLFLIYLRDKYFEMKNKTFLLLFFLITMYNSFFSQEAEDKQQKLFLKANFIGLGIAAEYNVYKNFTIHGQVSNRLTARVRYGNVFFRSWSQYFGGVRWYYNMNYREKRNKYTSGFSANYFSLITRQDLGPYIMGSTSKDFSNYYGNYIIFDMIFLRYYTGLQHGFQRYFTKKKNWYFDFNAGVGIVKYHKKYRYRSGSLPYNYAFDGMLGIGLKIK